MTVQVDNFYHDSGLSEDTIYHYRIRAFNHNQHSHFSNVQVVQTPLIPLDQPTNLVVNPVGIDGVDLSWDDIEGVDGFEIERSLDGSTNWSLVGTVTSGSAFSDRMLERGTTYYYRIRAFDPDQFSVFSAVVSATTAMTTSMSPIEQGYVPPAPRSRTARSRRFW